MSQPQPQNKCPDCLYMSLVGIPSSFTLEQIDLFLTINFNEQWEKLVGGRLKWGLRGGELRLTLTNGILPYSSRELTDSLELFILKKRVVQESRQAQQGLEGSISDMVILPAWAGKAGAKANVGKERTFGKTDEFEVTVCQVTTKGSEENPAWVFTVRTGEPVLKGLLKRAKLGTLDIKALPCTAIATFEVSSRDVYITDAEGLWPPDISRNKQAVLERMLALRLLRSKLQPYLSQAELRYE
ncbi:MAG: hypothetical protein JO235_18970 [Chroococcidiopsidaceae cyanobacterium CP_BM_RX_35]|nr:hypothetical protein [Chroococcidiopsidaceae cyanobacterium CP_BM_RX_35]